MVAKPPSPLPCEIRAGDSARWSRTLEGHSPADGWTLAYTLVSQTSMFSISASASGDGFEVELTSSDTAGWPPGRYTLVEYATRSAERATTGNWPIRVLPDLAGATAGVDTRSPARRIVDNIDAWMQSKNIAAGEVQLGDRRIRQYALAELLELRDYYAAQAARDESGAKGLVRRMVVKL